MVWACDEERGGIRGEEDDEFAAPGKKTKRATTDEVEGFCEEGSSREEPHGG